MNASDRHTIDVSIPSILGYERIAMAAAAALAAQLGFAQEQIDALKTAVSEACLNAIEHGNSKDAALTVLVSFSPEVSGLRIEVADQGRGIFQRPAPPRIEEKIAGRESPRGWGIYLIERLVDEVTFEERNGGGHVTRLLLRLQTQD